jgi:hypothetical protein
MALLAFPDIARFADDQHAHSSTSRPNPDHATMELLRDPVFEPIASLMKRSQRVKVAAELNAAILESQGLGGESKVKSLVRLMCWGEERLEAAGTGLGGNERGRAWAQSVLSEIGG